MTESIISQVLITTGEPLQTGVIHCEDCQRGLAQAVPDSSVDLIYIDPPFFSSRTYEVLWGDGYELRAFEDRWKGGIENYVAWMEPKPRECLRVLRSTGAIYLHCDWHASHYLKIFMDKLFGCKCFVNEIIWKRQTSQGYTKQNKAKEKGQDE